MFTDGNIPERISYNYSIKNGYKLQNADDMNVTITIREGNEKEDDPDIQDNTEDGNASGNSIANPYSNLHDSDGSSIGFGTLSSGNAKWVFDPQNSKTIIVVKQLDISKMFDSYRKLSNYNSSANHRYRVDNKKIAKVKKNGILKPKNRGKISIFFEQKEKGGSWSVLGEPVNLYIQMPEMKRKEQLSASPGEIVPANKLEIYK